MQKLDLSLATNDELAILAHFGDEEGSSLLWSRLIELAMRMSATFAKRYKWVDVHDLSQAVLLSYPKIISRYDPTKAKFSKYISISFYRAAQDELRKSDPLGIKIPQKSHYPNFAHLSSCEGDWPTGHDRRVCMGLIEDGLSRIDKGYNCLTSGE